MDVGHTSSSRRRRGRRSTNRFKGRVRAYIVLHVRLEKGQGYGQGRGKRVTVGRQGENKIDASPILSSLVTTCHRVNTEEKRQVWIKSLNETE